jgi:hypothetical protein
MRTIAPERLEAPATVRDLAEATPRVASGRAAARAGLRSHLASFAASTYLLAGATAIALLLLKIAYVFELKVNSDEPQHLHVVWAWTTGQLPYRDVFDNHAPLFQLLWSPILAALGERADIVEWMRISVLPIYFGCLGLIWRIGRQISTRAVAGAAVVFTAMFPPFFIVSTQFRPDDLWALLWLATVALLTGGHLDARRGAWSGLAAGATLAVSLKALLLLSTATIAALLVAAVARQTRPWRELLPWRFLAAFSGALLLIPGALAIFFVANGAGPAMFYALFQHNVVAGLGREEHGVARFLLAPLTLPLVLWFVWRIRPADDDLARWARASFALLAASGYLVVIYGYWPLFTLQDLLPAIPFVALGCALFVLRAGAARFALPLLRRAAIAAVLVGELGVLAAGHPLWWGHRGEFAARLARTLTLAQPQDYVMDAKGGTIFRHRPVYWVLEGITLARMGDGLIADDIAARLSATATPVVRPNRLPEPDLRFVEANYLALRDDVDVAGLRLGIARAGEAMHFFIAVPLDYTLVSPAGPTTGVIDAQPCSTRCALRVGMHTLIPSQDSELALVWSPALERGVDPRELFDPPKARYQLQSGHDERDHEQQALPEIE